MRVLVVDDEPDIRTSMQMVLEFFGHMVDTAENGAEAVDAAVRCRPDVVLLDLSMPVMDGFTAARKLRELDASSTLLIVATSAYVTNKDWCDRALAAGIDECLPKPVDLPRLQALLNSRGGSATA